MTVQATEPRIGPVDIRLPASSEHLRVLRLVSSSLAASLGLDVDQLDDLRIAVDELCSLLIEHAPPQSHLCVTLRDVDGHLLVDGELPNQAPETAVVDPVSQLILDGLDVDWHVDESCLSFNLVAPGRQHHDSS